jgi:hypothetical protein
VSKIVWLVVKGVPEEDPEYEGVFEDEKRAVDACYTGDHGYLPFTLNEACPEGESGVIPFCVYPALATYTKDGGETWEPWDESKIGEYNV